MPDAVLAKEPVLRPESERAKPREGIVVSTVTRLTTSDGRTFEETSKAIEHEAFYQILKRLVKDVGLPDNEETGSFAVNLAKHYRTPAAGARPAPEGRRHPYRASGGVPARAVVAGASERRFLTGAARRRGPRK